MATTTARYVFDQHHHRERERLGSMEALWDRGTRAAIESLGIAAGWRCLEVGAGAGSIAAWLAERVGTSGQVLATDLSTRHLAGLERPNLEIRRHDILRDPLPSDAFDLVHARLLVEHLGRTALERMVRCVRPGGWLLLEDLDWNAAAGFPDDKPVRGALDGLAAFMSRSGYDPEYGRRLIAELDRAGLVDVAADGRLEVYRGGTPAARFLALSLASVREALIAAGDLTAGTLDRALASLDDSDASFLSASMIAARGRKVLA